MITVTLDEYDLELLQSQAMLIAERNKALDINTMHRKNSVFQNVYEGIAAEYAVAKHFNLFPHLVADSKNGGFDLLKSGYRVDVKSTKLKNGRLLVEKWQADHPIDIYILTTGAPPSFIIVGWVFKKEIIQPDKLRDLGHGFTYALDQHELRKFNQKGV